jgi:hypothetical protein
MIPFGGCRPYNLFGAVAKKTGIKTFGMKTARKVKIDTNL